MHAASQKLPTVSKPDAVVAVALVAISSLVALSFAHYDGKFAFFPFYDDVTYLLQAQKRVDAIYDSGFLAWLKQAFQFADPHLERSAVMINLATLAFLVFGREAYWAPYLLLSIFPFLSIIVLRTLTRDVSLTVFAAAATVMFSVPITRAWTIEFRPDITWGFGLALSSALIIYRLKEYPKLIGLVASVVCLTKPAALPLSVGVLLVALTSAFIVDALSREGKGKILPAGTAFLAVFVGSTVALGFFTLPAAMKYLYEVMFVSPEPWTPGAGFIFNFTYYLTGTGGRYGLRYFWFVALVVVPVAIVTMLGSDRIASLKMSALVVTAIACFVAISLSNVKGALLGAPFFAFVAVLIFLSVAHLLNFGAVGLLRIMPRYAKVLSGILTLLVSVLAILSARPAPSLPSHPFLKRGSVDHEIAREVNDSILSAALEIANRSQLAEHVPEIAVVSFGPAVAPHIDYHLVVSSRRLHVRDLSGASESEVLGRASAFECLSIASGKAEWISFAKRDTQAIKNELLKRADFELVQEILIPGGKGQHWLLCKTSVAAAVKARIGNVPNAVERGRMTALH